jgi:hypothetical protein
MTHMAMRGWTVPHFQNTAPEMKTDMTTPRRTSLVIRLSYCSKETVPSSATYTRASGG